MSPFAVALLLAAPSRLRLWFENPNMAAVLLVELILVGAGAFRLQMFRRTGTRLAGAAACAVLVALLVLTESRGGLVSLGVAAGVALVACGRRRAVLALVVAVMAVAVVLMPRFRNVATDRSVLNRLDLWRAVPQMMADAPDGWGAGRSGLAYMNWYQPTERRERYRTMVGGHLTALVERGTVGRVLFLAFVFFLLGFGFLRARHGRDALPLALWTALFSSAVFSTTTERFELWILPVAATVPALATAVRRPKAVAACAAAALLVAGASVGSAVWFACPGGMPVSVDAAGTVVYGRGGERSALVADPDVLGGDGYPRDLRRACARCEAGTWIVTEDLSRVPADVERLVLSGKAALAVLEDGALVRFGALRSLVLVSPPYDVTARRPKAPAGVTVRTVCGEFASCCPMADAPGVTVVPGVARYVPTWAELAMKEENR